MKKFKKIYIEITNQCNLTCAFCPRSRRAPQFMTISFFTEIIHKIRRYTDYLYFHVMGEPLMHPELGEMLDICHEHVFKVNITTNGTLIKRLGPVIAAKPALRQINISLHCQSAQNSDDLRDDYFDDVIAFVKGVKSGGEKVITQYLSLSEIEENKHENKFPSASLKEREQLQKMIVCLRLWNLPENGGFVDNSRILQRIGQEFGCEDRLADQSKVLDGVNLADNVFLTCAPEFDWPGFDKQDRGMTGFCHGLRDQLAILVDGTGVPCCLDAYGEIALGNIGDQDLSAIIQGARAKAIYEGFSKRMVVEELCRKCGYRTRFDLNDKPQ